MRRAILFGLAICALAAPAAGAATLPDSWQKGANVDAFWWRDLSSTTFGHWMSRLRATGADHVYFAVPWYQYWSDATRTNEVDATEIHASFGSRAVCKGENGSNWVQCKTPSMDALRRAIFRAKSLGLKVGIKPLVDVGRNQQTSASRTAVDIKDPVARSAWFDSYRYMLSQYARLARDTQADTLVVGTGLNGMTNDPDDQAQWRATIASVRDGTLMGDGKGGFTGSLTYAANWNTLQADAIDPAAGTFFWDALDEIGVEGYYVLVKADKKGTHDNPSRRRIAQGWSRDEVGLGLSPVETLRRLNKEYGKPVVMTGLGYLSRGGTVARPSRPDASQARKGGKVNPEAQLRAYQAAFDVWSDLARKEGWFHGIYWWDWQPGRTKKSSDGDYSPQDKPAEMELCHRQGGRCR